MFTSPRAGRSPGGGWEERGWLCLNCRVGGNHVDVLLLNMVSESSVGQRRAVSLVFKARAAEREPRPAPSLFAGP